MKDLCRKFAGLWLLLICVVCNGTLAFAGIGQRELDRASQAPNSSV